MLEKDVTVESYDVYPSGILKPSALMRYMQQLAREDCDALGATYYYMRSLNTVFVLTKFGIEFVRPLRSGETFTLRTFNNSINGVIFDREFELVSKGETAARASTFWTLVRYDTRALVRPKDFPVKFESLGLELRGVEVPRRFDDTGTTETEIRRVRVSDLDENNHLNNCVYADIALDAISDFNGLDNWAKSVKIIFRHEARLGDELFILRKNSNGAEFVFASVGEEKKPCFEAEIVIEDIRRFLNGILQPRYIGAV